MRQGEPAAMTSAGMVPLTTEPAPMTELSPIVEPLSTLTPLPRKTFRADGNGCTPAVTSAPLATEVGVERVEVGVVYFDPWPK